MSRVDYLAYQTIATEYNILARELPYQERYSKTSDHTRRETIDKVWT
jgi:hypothetical protein